ncbi:MAG: response regulator transcription factor [Betaproteobacteria bacterium]
MNILLIEDEPRIAEFVRHGLCAAGFSVDHAQDGEEGLARSREQRHETIVLDIMLPKVDGYDVLRQIRKEGNHTPVIILSAKVDLPYRLLGFEVGADDYLPKPFFVEELVARIKALQHRRTTEAPQELRFQDLALNVVTRRAQWHETSATLSQREFTLMEYLLQSPGHIYSRKNILKYVWDIDFDPETNVVDVCVQRIKRKLSRKDHASLSPIESVRGVGYRIRAEPEQ